MIPIADMLPADNVCLSLEGTDPARAVESVCALLRNDTQVVDWEKLARALRASAPCAAERGCEFGMCIPHSRTDAVTRMVMSVGRSENGIVFPECARPIRYIFAIGVPTALDSDYLRIVGLLARVLKTPHTEARLREAETPGAFVRALSRLEAQL